MFSEINFHYARLAVLGTEAKKVLDDMKSEGMPSEPVDQFYELARKAAGLDAEGTPGESKNESKRCKWWNRGFCRERKKCSFSRVKGDCQEHLAGGCTTKGFNTLRHRKRCRYFSTKQGCH